MMKTIAAFDRIGEQNAFAVLARATHLAAQGGILLVAVGLDAWSRRRAAA